MFRGEIVKGKRAAIPVAVGIAVAILSAFGAFLSQVQTTRYEKGWSVSLSWTNMAYRFTLIQPHRYEGTGRLDDPAAIADALNVIFEGKPGLVFLHCDMDFSDGRIQEALQRREPVFVLKGIYNNSPAKIDDDFRTPVNTTRIETAGLFSFHPSLQRKNPLLKDSGHVAFDPSPQPSEQSGLHRAPLLFMLNGRVYPHAALLSAVNFMGADASNITFDGREIRADSLIIRTDPSARITYRHSLGYSYNIDGIHDTVIRSRLAGRQIWIVDDPGNTNASVLADYLLAGVNRRNLPGIYSFLLLIVIGGIASLSFHDRRASFVFWTCITLWLTASIVLDFGSVVYWVLPVSAAGILVFAHVAGWRRCGRVAFGLALVLLVAQYGSAVGSLDSPLTIAAFTVLGMLTLAAFGLAATGKPRAVLITLVCISLFSLAAFNIDFGNRDALILSAEGMLLSGMFASLLVLLVQRYSALYETVFSVIVYGFACNYVLGQWDLVLPETFAYAALILPPLSAAIADKILIERERRKIRNAFGKYLSRQVLEKVTKTDSADEIGKGRRKAVTVAFFGIKEFGGLCNEITPTELQKILNRFFQVIVDCAFRYDATLDKIMGGSMMVFFGDPLETSDHHLRAIEMAKAVIAGLKNNGLNIPVGIGMEHGEVVVGNLGGKEFISYTCIGDRVNLAARLEAMAKDGEILIGPGLADLVNSDSLTSMGKVWIKGKKDQVEVFLMK